MNALLEVWNQVKISPDRCLNSVVACCLSALTTTVHRCDGKRKEEEDESYRDLLGRKRERKTVALFNPLLLSSAFGASKQASPGHKHVRG